MEGTSAKEAICWQKNMDALPTGCPQPALLDISWFTESMAAGQPVPEEGRHHLEVAEPRKEQVESIPHRLQRRDGVSRDQQQSSAFDTHIQLT